MLSRIGRSFAAYQGSARCYLCAQNSSSASQIRNLTDGAGRDGRQRLVIVGTGWGGFAVFKTVDRKLYDVVVVSQRDHFLFTPLLASTTVGTLEFRSIIEPVRYSKFRTTADFHLSNAMSLDTSSNVLKCESLLDPGHRYDLPYDKLVLALGALSNTFGVPGVQENAFFLKEISDARSIRHRLVSNLELSLQSWVTPEERQRLLHVVVVGGGPTGVEFSAELYDFMTQDAVRMYGDAYPYMRVTLVEAASILGAFDSRLSSYAEKKISKHKGLEIRKASVTKVTGKDVTLDNGDVIPCGIVVWSTGLAPRTFIRSLDLPKAERTGQLLTNRHLQVLGANNVYALGDCADIKDYSLPCTAQVAERQGRYLSRSLGSSNAAEEFQFQNMGMMAYIGGYSAVTDVPNLKFKGPASWFLWRSAYLTRLGSWRLRFQVPVDWLKTMLFGRDVSKF